MSGRFETRRLWSSGLAGNLLCKGDPILIFWLVSLLAFGNRCITLPVISEESSSCSEGGRN